MDIQRLCPNLDRTHATGGRLVKRVSRSMKLKFMGIGPGKSQPRWKRGIKLIVADTLRRLRPFARARNTSLRSDSKLWRSRSWF